MQKQSSKMSVDQEQVSVDIEYFQLNFGEESKEGHDLVQTELSVTLSKEQINTLLGIKPDGEMQQTSNKGKKLMIYNDKSGSMSGRPYEAVLAASKSLADLVFSEDGNTDQNVFETVRTVFYHNSCLPSEANTKQAYLQRINNEDNHLGGTSFYACFQDITQDVKKLK